MKGKRGDIRGDGGRSRSASRLPWLFGLLGLFWVAVSPTAPLVPEPRLSLSEEERLYLERLGPIRVCPDPDWEPFEALDEQGNFTGIAIDLLDLIAGRLGIEFRYVVARDWDEAVALSRAGEVLILPFLNRTAARDEWLLFTEPLLVDPSVFITREEHPFIPDATRLTDRSIVLPTGTSVEEHVRRDFPNLSILGVPTEKDVFQAVSSRRADLTLRSLTVAAYTIRKEGLFNLKIAGQAPEPYVNRLRMGVLKSEPRLRDILDRAIATITPGERDRIVNRHVNVTIVKPMDYGFILRIAGGLAALIALSFYWNLRLKNTNAALRESERSKSVLIANLPGVAYRCRHDRAWTMEFISEGCLELTGYASEDLRLNKALSYNDLIVPEDRERIWRIWEQARSQGRAAQLEYRIITADGQEKWVFERGVFVNREGDGQVLAIEGLIIDITARKRAEEELYRISTQDELTGIQNRRSIMRRLDTLIEEQAREHDDFSVALIDLDFFKKINDTHGHLAGDFILSEFAAILVANFRPYDLVGRYGGEEFMVVTPHSDGGQAERMLSRLRAIIHNHVFDFNGVALRITFSAGVASSRDLGAGVTVANLIDRADQRLYLAKEQGRDRIVGQGPAFATGGA
ncbi:diguanylate cyclase [Thiocystis violacea]|uniref:diguanylate cyclase n=1 Tax=Thiocystis violacea TaxID=13725 RepID=UPI00190678FF|nr:diguanylate cyclase [Thiocystis violacea]MBK1720221.1 diguanylate cyclase [Thiocystis violacea]